MMAAFAFAACGSDDSEDCPDNRAANETSIIEYLDANSITDATRLPDSGLWYRIVEPGNDTKPTISSTISILYRGTDINDNIFEERVSDPAVFPLSNLIQGWQLGLPLIGEGGRINLYIPAHLAYDCAPPSRNGVVIFDIQLVDVS